MAAYKVIQDIEAEDKLLGPLTLRQFIYALIAAMCFYFTFLVVSKGATFISPIFVLPGLVAVFFAIPWSKQQPTEVWALAKIRFIVKPRKRIWDQAGVKELVTITVPKQIHHELTNGLDQTEVHSRLSALANTLDSRGWAVKNVNVNLAAASTDYASDRLVASSNLPQEVPNFVVTAADDMLDETNNPVAHQFDTLITQQTKTHRQQILDRLNQASQATPTPQPPTPVENYWFMNQAAQQGPVDVAGQAQFTAAPAVLPGATGSDVKATPEEEAIARAAALNNHETFKHNFGHMKTILPAGAQPPVSQPVQAAQQAVDDALNSSQTVPAAVTAAPDPAIMKLAGNNDLDVATLARQAKKDKQAEADEVVVSFH